MSIRGTGISAMLIRSFKANAIGMGQPDTYEALRKGIVEATLCPIETLKGWRQGEVINEVVKIPSAGYTTAMFVVMNKRRWESLPEDVRQIIRQVNEEWIPKHGRQWDEADQVGAASVAELGKPIITITPVVDAKAKSLLEPLLTRWGRNLDSKNHPGSDAIAFLQKALHASDKELEALLADQYRHSSLTKKSNVIATIVKDVRQHLADRITAIGHALFIACILTTLIIAGLLTHFTKKFQMAFWNCYQRVVSFMASLLRFIAEMALLLIILVTIVDVIGRRLGLPLPGAIDLVQILACISTTAALPYVTAVKGHIAVEYFFQRFSTPTQIFWDSLSRTAIILFFSYMTLACFQQGIRLYIKHAMALSLGIPLFWILYVMGFSFILVILVVTYNLTHPGRPMMNP